MDRWCPTPNAAGGGGSRPGGYGGGGRHERGRRLAEGAHHLEIRRGARRGARAAGGRQLRQRLLRRGARHRRCSGRSDASHRLGHQVGRCGQAGGLPRLRCGCGRRSGPCHRHDLVAARGGRRRHRRRMVLHRRSPPVRLRRTGRGVRVRVLRGGGHHRFGIRADRADHTAHASRLDPGGAAGHGAPRRQQPP